MNPVGPTLITLRKGHTDGLRIAPRWPSSQIQLDASVLARLHQAQAQLPPAIRLLLTRGYEPRRSGLGGFRTLSRWLGIRLFRTCYPQRHAEVEDIFGANGHDLDGGHVDVSIVLDGRRLRFLPLGVFTSLPWQQQRIARHADCLAAVKQALHDSGFDIHRNPTESLQIHCDVRP